MVISRIKIHPLYVILPSHYFPSSSPPPAYRNSPPAFLLCDPIESFRYKSSTDRGVEERWKRCPSLFSLLSFLSSRVQPRRRFIERIRSWTTFHDSEREKGIIKNEPLPKMSRAHVCSRWRLCNAILVFYFFFFLSLFLLHTYLLFSHRLKNFSFSFPSRSFLTPHWLLARRTWKRAPVEIWVKQRRSLLKYRRRSCLITGVGSSITHWSNFVFFNVTFPTRYRPIN